MCAGFARSLAHKNFKTAAVQKMWLIFFSSIAVASFTGGSVHGFFLDESSVGFKILWPLTLLSIGITASAAWVLVGLFAFGQKALKPSIIFSSACFLIYSIVVLAFSQNFLVVIVNYMPPILLLFFTAIKEFRRTKLKSYTWIAIGIAISLLAAYFQQAKIAIHPQYFTHNSTYHLIQAFGLASLFYGASGLTHAEWNS